jgi:large subunit ribosomal protein L13
LANFDLGNHVVLVNASKVKFTGDKLDNKYYYNHSGYPGKPRKRSTKEMVEKYPVELIRRII